MKGFAIIGDVHSQSLPLARALQYCYERNLRPILLGDLFDSHCGVSDSVEVYRLVRRAQRDLDAIVLRSNHQFVLERLARKRDVPLKKDIARTVKDFQEAGICIKKVGKWLEKFPYLVAFRDSSGREFRVAHAEIPDTISVPASYNGVWEFHTPTESEAKLLLWGKPYSLPEKERFWWLLPSDRKWVSVAGHYHKVVRKNNALVLDGGCGGVTRSWYDKRSPELLLYEVERRELIGFSVFA
jgi:hypothetical protein